MEEVPVKGVQILEYCVSYKICHEFFVNSFPYFVNCYSHAMSCTPCAKAKAACKPFKVDKACAKAKTETVWKSKAKKVKQQTDVEWKAEISRELVDLSELRGLRKNVRRIAVALEKLAGIEGQDSEEELLSWSESEGEETELQGSKEKEKQKEKKIDRAEKKEEVRGQEEENRMESMEEGSSSFSPVAYSVGIEVL